MDSNPTETIQRSYHINDLLHRRGDLSTFVVHLTSGLDDLNSILGNMRIEARRTFGHNPRNVDDAWSPPNVVCMSEVPLSQLWTLCSKIEGRSQKLAPFGILFSRNWARTNACNPVLYSDMTPGHNWLHNRIDAAYNDSDSTGKKAIEEFSRFIEPMGSYNTTREFWWEREWRHIGDLSFSLDDVVAILVPEEMSFSRPYLAVEPSSEGNARSVAVLDPRWGLERMILELSGVSFRWPFPSSEIQNAPSS